MHNTEHQHTTKHKRDSMFDQIQRELKRLEAEHNITILYAVESGSRAWGFASTDSDWDVRFFYVHNQDWYLSIDDKRDTIEEILPNDIDLSGWELRKALKLFRKSNPPMLEWLRSPIVYAENYTTAESLRQLSAEYFSPKSCLYHYLHMAERNAKAYLQRDMVRVKKYLYVLRPLLACGWIEINNTAPPMEFDALVEELVHDAPLKEAITTLTERKRAGEELDVEPRIPILDRFIDKCIKHFHEFLRAFDYRTQPDTDKLNDLFRATLQEVKESQWKWNAFAQSPRTIEEEYRFVSAMLEYYNVQLADVDAFGFTKKNRYKYLGKQPATEQDRERAIRYLIDTNSYMRAQKVFAYIREHIASADVFIGYVDKSMAYEPDVLGIDVYARIPKKAREEHQEQLRSIVRPRYFMDNAMWIGIHNLRVSKKSKP
jgi:predicted nucleotidyltransferase